MAPFRCSGLQQGTELRTCVFSRSTSQEKALGTFDGKCVWCNPSRMETVCATPQLKKLLVYNLRVLSIMDHAMTTRMACMRIPEEHRAEIVLAATGRHVGHYAKVALMLPDPLWLISWRRRLREKSHPTDAAMLDTVLDNPRQDLSRHPQPWKKAPR